MPMNNTVKARFDLAMAEAQVKFVAQRISEPDCTPTEKFDLLWDMVFVDLQCLETHREPL